MIDTIDHLTARLLLILAAGVILAIVFK